MNIVLRYGTDASADLALREESLLAYCPAPLVAQSADVTTTVERALQEPIGFPPLAQAVLPGDKVALAFAPGCLAEVIVRVTIESLMAAGVNSSDITLVRHVAGRRARRRRPFGDGGSRHRSGKSNRWFTIRRFASRSVTWPHRPTASRSTFTGRYTMRIK